MISLQLLISRQNCQSDKGLDPELIPNPSTANLSGWTLNSSGHDSATALQGLPATQEYHLDSDRRQVIEHLNIEREELAWTELDTLKLKNQVRKIQKLPPLNLDGTEGRETSKNLYPSSRDHVRWELMRG